MPRRTKAESDATAAAVLAAARGLFAERGYADVRVDDVARAAGVTRGAVYHHYTDKPGLFAAVVALVHAEVADAVAEEGRLAHPWQALRAGCHAFLAASVDDTRRRIMLVDAPAVLGWGTWRVQDAEHAGRHLDDALRDLDEAGLLDVPSVAAASALLSGAMNEAAMWVAGQDRPEALREAATTLDVLLGSIRREEAPPRRARR